jgi:hypothetical protein
MNVNVMAHAIKEIQELQPALDWLSKYGRQLQPADRESFSIRISPHFADACPGCIEATNQINAVARLFIQAIIERAIEDAENTIALRRGQIAREAASEAPT